MENLLKLLAENGGRIVSTASLSVALIDYAKSENRMFVDEYGLGFVYVPNEAAQASVNTTRSIRDHQNNKFNRECVSVMTCDDRSSDGANHKYEITVWKNAQTSDSNDELVEHCKLNFQNGGLKEVGANGITDQSLIAVVMDRIRGFNDGPFRCRENSMVITKLEEAMMWMEKRSNDRARRGVEGERKE
ncbi:MAG TPA: hypothetical protein VNI84_18985 [Pyrinomonadaceae bacterium]|nr:hypothetical protein [Pyrinomonadaceae bacterium]